MRNIYARISVSDDDDYDAMCIYCKKKVWRILKVYNITRSLKIKVGVLNVLIFLLKQDLMFSRRTTLSVKWLLQGMYITLKRFRSGKQSVSSSSCCDWHKI